ncbi:GNAT family N-acetyltransferase [soil metagenome]
MAEVRDNTEESQFEILVDDVVAGYAVYRRRPGRIFFVHTVVDPAFEGQGLGSQLVVAALDAVRAECLKVVPLCPFFAAYIDGHPQYQDLVDDRMMDLLTKPA